MNLVLFWNLILIMHYKMYHSIEDYVKHNHLTSIISSVFYSYLSVLSVG